ncbi:unnamed protein product [Meloidogyne enterolobii]|uniref:Uncharacterized protein n=1 Tax=Meloidogyne enterolobii TaxID=390850 RepID=A0ACB0ZDH5_MELEN
MMDQYREQKFPRDHPQWTKCVINYLLDAFKPDTFQLIIVLTEMLERSPIALHSSLLDMLLLLFNYGSLNNCPPAYFNSQIVKTIFKHIHGSSSREASRIFKVILEQWNAISVDKISQNEKDFLAKRKPEFEIRFEKPFLHEISVDKLSSLDSFGSARQKIRKKLLTLFSTFGLPIGATRHLSLLSKSFTDIQQDQLININIEEKEGGNNQKQQQHQSNLKLESKDDYSTKTNQQPNIDRMSSPKSFGGGPSLGGGGGGGNLLQQDHHSSANSCELISLRTTDSFPRVFKEFDFLEAEHDSVSESAESCFNWLSTMRTPRVCSEINDINTQNDQDELGDDEEEFYEDNDLDSNNSNNNTRCDDPYSPKSFRSGGTNSSCCNRHSSLESVGGGSGGGGGGGLHKNIATNIRRRRRKGGGGREGGGERGESSFNLIRRPLSGASDSNDVSSDRTPIQSTHHSDESSSEFASEGEQQQQQQRENIEEEDEGGEDVEEEEEMGGGRREMVGGRKEESEMRRESNLMRICGGDNQENNQLMDEHKMVVMRRKENKKFSKILLSSISPRKQQQQNQQQFPSSSTTSTISPSINTTTAKQHKLIGRRNSSAESSSQHSNSLHTTTTHSIIPLFSEIQQQHQQFKQQQNTKCFDEEQQQQQNNYLRLECSHHISGMLHSSVFVLSLFVLCSGFCVSGLFVLYSGFLCFCISFFNSIILICVEHLWNNLISRLDNDQNGIIISNSIILLTQLFREKSIFLVRILRDSLDIFNSSQQQKMSTDISQLFLRSLNFLLKFVECPFLFVSSQFINSSNLLDSIKIALFELREHFDAFNEHYEQSLRVSLYFVLINF